MNLPLRHYQAEFRDAYVRRETAVCAFEQGLGKTLTAIAIVLELLAEEILVISPSTVLTVWRAEIEKWDPEAEVEIPRGAKGVRPSSGKRRYTLVNPDKLVRNGELLEALAKRNYCIMILDESHMFKTPSARRTQVVFRVLAPLCKRILPMSGTPCPNHAGELYTMLRYLGRDLITKPNGEVWTQREFEDRYCITETKIIAGRHIRVIKGSRNIQELLKRIGSFLTRRTKAQCIAELLPMQYETMPLELSPLDLRQVAVLDRPDLDDDELLRHLESDEHMARALRHLGTAKAAAFAAFAHDWMANTTGKMVVWCRFHDEIDLLMRELEKYRPAKIDGRDSLRKREFAVHKFLNDDTCRVWVGQILASGTGLSLVSNTVQPTDVFFISQEWNFGANAQAAARVHRLTTRGAVLVRTIVADGVRLDKRVADVLTRKMREIGELIDGTV